MPSYLLQRLIFLGLGLGAASVASVAPAAAQSGFAYELRQPSSFNVAPRAPEGEVVTPPASTPVTLTLEAGELVEGARGAYFQFDLGNLLAIGGSAPPSLDDIVWRVVSGTLPADVVLNAEGRLEGEPTNSGESVFEVEAAFEGVSTRQTYTIVVGKTPLEVVQYSTAGSRACVLTADDKVFCWGNGSTPSMAASATPVPVQGLPVGIARISVGGSHACAVTVAGQAYCWGGNDRGQLGDNTQTTRGTAALVSGIVNVTAIYAGGYGTCAIQSGGALYCWGENDFGQVGDGSTVRALVPKPVVGLGSGVTSVVYGYSHACAIHNGAVKCWGADFYGQLGNDTELAGSLVPVSVSGLGAGVSQIESGVHHTCARTTSGAVRCWGNGEFGQTGDASRAQATPTPIVVSGLSGGVTHLGVRLGHHNCAAMVSGAVNCWGQGTTGQLGDGYTTNRSSGAPVVGVTVTGGAVLAGGGSHACAWTPSGSARCWGANGAGQLGDGTTTNRTSPVEVTWEY